MTRPSVFLALLFFAAYPAKAGESLAHAPLPLIGAPSGAPSGLLACAVITLAALALAWLGLRRSATRDEEVHGLQAQLSVERAARSQSDQALADNHDVLCRMVRQQEGVRESERSRIASQLQAELGCRLLTLRKELSRLHDNAPGAGTGRLDVALAHLDATIGVVRAVSGGLRGFGPGDGLRHALERCLAEHAHLHGVRYRFEAGIDPSSRAGQDRTARLAVFRVLQDVLATTQGKHAGAPHEGELHVRLLEGAASLGLEIDGCPAAPDHVDALPCELVDHIRAMGGVLRVIATAERRGRWSLSVPVQVPASRPTVELAGAA